MIYSLFLPKSLIYCEIFPDYFALRELFRSRDKRSKSLDFTEFFKKYLLFRRESRKELAIGQKNVLKLRNSKRIKLYPI